MASDGQKFFALPDGKAADLMSSLQMSVEPGTPLQEAVEILTDWGLGAVPVVDGERKPIGILSLADIVRYSYDKRASSGASGGGARSGTRMRTVDDSPVSKVMTKTVHSVTPDVSVVSVVNEMLLRNTHRLFVVGEEGTLKGVITVTDIVRNLKLGKA